MPSGLQVKPGRPCRYERAGSSPAARLRDKVPANLVMTKRGTNAHGCTWSSRFDSGPQRCGSLAHLVVPSLLQRYATNAGGTTPFHGRDAGSSPVGSNIRGAVVQWQNTKIRFTPLVVAPFHPARPADRQRMPGAVHRVAGSTPAPLKRVAQSVEQICPSSRRCPGHTRIFGIALANAGGTTWTERLWVRIPPAPGAVAQSDRALCTFHQKLVAMQGQ
ncbi:hypothetical protein SAMN05216189_1005154 [Pseudomonas delhiensis]|uniref:Uncharacterized protein n=1 Tax=Pseudomonas delhiensis TaxID=366289 RepID=A0A239HQQ9_9PSED|nr:hypothetical protein SAMN05216189_1005154 [Pseudomonas delhiensis]SNS83620.1 hypothetical protein SAMN06295949_10833 [Pseudomonas delhiensis]